MVTDTGKSRRGFASLDPDRVREIARAGGRAAHAKGRAHRFTTDEARAAGKKGGLVTSRKRGALSAAGRRGGEARAAQIRAERSGAVCPTCGLSISDPVHRGFGPCGAEATAEAVEPT